ncbi:histone deacetylase 6 isoform X1 [Eupeodes corollae]|uniref:histone deacetylase 6 isoform X1 n=3 Tax=Eupeodes corollae TaxID=290404 RepID=UPI002490A4AF|nr:histone deacetylase 6 isoform X1 [Eupeodes corollae]XP_055910186.1 histone deacetylase 6 isoform X1 [Eupeodes corollae]XP_055910187.1 histone deacetylase 6 isoform X1 [Eupeodes corollae]
MNQNSPVVTRGGAQKAKIQTRAMLKSVEQRRPNATLQEAKRKAKLLKMQQQSQQEIVVKDIFQNAMSAINSVQGYTGVIYDESMSEHRCLWDGNYPERPERFTRILERCKSLGLLDRCQRIPSRRATKDEILLKHTDEHYELLKTTANMKDEAKLEDLSSQFDSIYLHPSTFDLSLLATGCTIDLVENVVNGSLQNGMAIIRPPGHHAMKAEFNGYCFFNNVAIAAQYALDILKLQRILIVDYDIHHGQGTQRLFYNDPRVLYFSTHRYDHGTFWPNIKESDFDAIGEGAGLGYNFNLPLNQPGMTNSDYLAIYQQILIPVAVEFQPELIIVSAGYDAALGCPEGEMEVTPAFYPHLLNSFVKLAQSKIAVILEGGYCLESLAEGAALTLKTLLGDPCPLYVEDLTPPCESVQDTILNCIYAHRPFWRCLQIQQTYTMEELNNVNPQPDLHKVSRIFIGGPPLEERFPTRDCYPVQSPETIQKLDARLQWLKAETNLSVPPVRVCYVYDEMMLEHQNMFEEGHPEQPKRIKTIYDMHFDYGLLKRMEKLKSRHATTDEICLAHTRSHLNSMRRTGAKEELAAIGEKYNSVYFHPKTFECATLAAGSVLQVVDSVLKGESRSGVCIVRPPGHHAEPDVPQGFCIFNNIAIAAQYAIRDHKLKRVLIVDWDVHHGNGTQHIFENNPNVLYISVHRYDNATFFPKSTDANYDVVGKGLGEGFNVNIPWNKKGMGDAEYVLAFQQLIMPIAYEFNPELVLVSAGFDAAIGDPLGGCKVTPEAYGLFTHWLSALANGRIIVCLEGGYNVNSISYAMTMCTKSLLGDPLPPISTPNISSKPSAAYSSCIETIQNCLTVQQRYWNHLKFNKKLPECSGENNNEDFLSATLKNLNITSDDAQGAAGGSIGKAPTPPPPLVDDEQQPGTSKPAEKVKTLKEFVSENLEALQNEEMFAVVPLKTCPHLSQLCPQDAPTIIDVTTPCFECSSTIENWLCLICAKTLCGRYVMEHMLYHNLESSHSLALSYSDLSVWCYPCESYIDNSKLHVYKNLAHRNKFGVDMVWSYENEDVADNSDDDDESNYIVLHSK